MSEQVDRNPESSGGIEKTLRDNCVSLRRAMRDKENKILNFDRQRITKLLSNTDTHRRYSASQLNNLAAQQLPGRQQVRSRLRENLMVPLGTRLSGEGHSMTFFWAVREPEESVIMRTGDFEFEVSEIIKDSASSNRQENLMYRIHVLERGVLVTHDGAQLHGDELAEPLNIIQEFRGLYV